MLANELKFVVLGKREDKRMEINFLQRNEVVS